MELNYRGAGIHDCQLLTDTAWFSKQSWGYTSEEMNLWRGDLKIDESYILEHTVAKVFNKEKYLGFFGLIETNSSSLEIDHLWLLPAEMRKGFGSLIFNHILKYAKENNFDKATLIAEPNAKGFYEKMNGTPQEKFESKIKNRYLDIYHFNF